MKEILADCGILGPNARRMKATGFPTTNLVFPEVMVVFEPCRQM